MFKHPTPVILLGGNNDYSFVLSNFCWEFTKTVHFVTFTYLNLVILQKRVPSLTDNLYTCIMEGFSLCLLSCVSFRECRSSLLMLFSPYEVGHHMTWCVTI